MFFILEGLAYSHGRLAICQSFEVDQKEAPQEFYFIDIDYNNRISKA